MLESGSREEEDDDGIEDAVEHPSEDAEPAEEHILNTLLVEERELAFESRAER